MTLQALDGFKSLQTHHCITGSIRHVYEYNGYPISEDMLLGLGSGLGFMYWRQKGAPPMYGGRANVERPGEIGLEKTIGQRTGVGVESFFTGSATKARTALLNMLKAGQPVMVYVDMAFLPYFDFSDDSHFGGHAIVVAGYDEQTGQVLVADRDLPLHPISLDQLAQARGSTFKPFPPRNAWYTFDFANKRPPEAAEIRQAIRDVTRGMLEPPIANFGVKGIRTAAKRTREWSKIMDEEALRWACFNTFIFIDSTGGTGGGIFRYMYGRFLKEAADITGDKQLAESGEELRVIGDRWQEVAQIFHDAYTAQGLDSSLAEATERVLTIADLEEAAWAKLQAVVTPA